jgi:hypothetical protein
MSMVSGIVSAGMFRCLIGLPLVLVWLVTGVMIAMRARNNQTAAFMALGGIALAALELVVGVGSSIYTPLLAQEVASMQSIGVALSAIGVVQTLIGAVAWGLILAALVMALGKPGGPDEPHLED